MRLLTFMQMAENQKEISFEIIEKELKIQSNEIEAFIIDVLRTKLVRAKIDQLQKRVLVGSTMHRTFGKPQWQQLREILTRWRSNLNQVEGSLDEVIRAQYEPVAPIQS